MSNALVLTGTAHQATPSLDEIYRRYRGPVQSYLYRLCGSTDLAEDLAQETFANACAGLLSFRGESSVATWLFRIARNTYLGHLRRPSHTRIPTEELHAIPSADGAGDPSRHVAALEHRDLIRITLGQLPEKHRSILLLRDSEGLSYAEIADVLELSLAAVKVNLFRARHAFRQAYAQLTGDDGATV